MNMQRIPRYRRGPDFAAVPEIAEAYKNDPRTQLAMSALAQGADTSPVAGGKWAWADGLARALQGVGGGYVAKQQMKRYAEDERGLLAARADQARRERLRSAMPGVQATAESAAVALGAPQQAGGAPSAGMPPFPPALAQGQPPAMLRPAAFRPLPPPPSPAKALPAVRPERGTSTNYASYKSPAYDALEEKYAAKHGIPKELLTGIRTRGERSNANQVSPAGARSVYQFIPSTRRAFMEKHGLDPWSSPEAAAESAAIHLKESLVRNNGDVTAAIGEYIGGPDRKRWGKTTRAYIKRVADGLTDGGARKVGDPPEYAPIPDLPPPPERPMRPDAEGPTESRTLRAAYDIMEGGNRYDAARAARMYEKGLAEQSGYDESAATRRQNLTDAEYQGDLNVFNTERGYAARDPYDQRNAARDRNWQIDDREDAQQYGTAERVAGQKFNAAQSAAERAFRASEAEKDRTFTASQNEREWEVKRAARADEVQNRRSQFFATSSGSKFATEVEDNIARNDMTIGILNAMDRELETAKTGGFIRGNVPGFTRWSDESQQHIESLSGLLALEEAQKMKGSLSDSDRKFVGELVPSIRKTGRVNRQQIARMRAVAERSSEYELGRLQSRQDGRVPQFQQEWRAYRSQYPDAVGAPAFSEWLASRPRYNAQGQRIN